MNENTKTTEAEIRPFRLVSEYVVGSSPSCIVYKSTLCLLCPPHPSIIVIRLAFVFEEDVHVTGSKRTWNEFDEI